jgi:hypothetical protein
LGESPEFGQLGQEREGDHPAHAGHALQQVILDAPQRARLHRGVPVVIGLAQAALEVADVLLKVPNPRMQPTGGS